MNNEPKHIKVSDSFKGKIKDEVKIEGSDTRTGRSAVHHDSKNLHISKDRKKLENLIIDFVENEKKKIRKIFI